MTNVNLSADPKKDGIPVELQVQNRQPVDITKMAAIIAAKKEAPKPAAVAKSAAEEGAKFAAEQAELKKAKTVVRKANAKAATVPAPLEGKAALAAIKAKPRKGTKPGNGAKKPAKATKAPKAKAKAASKPKDGPRAGSKLALVAQLLQRAKGCTMAEVLAATGWPSVSMPQQAKAAGLKLIKEKNKGEVTRYRAG